MKNMLKQIGALALVAALAACSGGNQSEDNSQAAVLKDLRTVVKASREARRNPPAPFKITRALLDQQTVGSLEVTVEQNNQTAYLIPSAFRSDALPGRVTVWRTLQGEHVILRGGILIATRGLGRDLASSDASASLRAIRAGGTGGGERRMQVRNDVHGADEILLQCETRNLGPETIDIIERRFSVRHLQETCQVGTEQIINAYWVNRSGKVLQSRQWAGPGIGYVTLRVLK